MKKTLITLVSAITLLFIISSASQAYWAPYDLNHDYSTDGFSYGYRESVQVPLIEDPGLAGFRFYFHRNLVPSIIVARAFERTVEVDFARHPSENASYHWFVDRQQLPSVTTFHSVRGCAGNGRAFRALTPYRYQPDSVPVLTGFRMEKFDGSRLAHIKLRLLKVGDTPYLDILWKGYSGLPFDYQVDYALIPSKYCEQKVYFSSRAEQWDVDRYLLLAPVLQGFELKFMDGVPRTTYDLGITLEYGRVTVYNNSAEPGYFEWRVWAVGFRKH